MAEWNCSKCRYGNSEDYTACMKCRRGSEYKEKPISWGNKIRAMSDEELAEYLSDLIRNAHEYHTGEGDWLQWLKSEAKE